MQIFSESIIRQLPIGDRVNKYRELWGHTADNIDEVHLRYENFKACCDYLARVKDMTEKEAEIAQNNPFNMNGEQTGDLAQFGAHGHGQQPNFMQPLKHASGGTLSSRNIARDGLEKFQKSGAHPDALKKDAISKNFALNLQGLQEGNHNASQNSARHGGPGGFHANEPQKMHTQASQKKTLEAIKLADSEEKRLNINDLNNFGKSFEKAKDAGKMAGFSPRNVKSIRTPRSQQKELEIAEIQKKANAAMPVTRELNMYNEAARVEQNAQLALTHE